jgi:hypothetical protein
MLTPRRTAKERLREFLLGDTAAMVVATYGELGPGSNETTEPGSPADLRALREHYFTTDVRSTRDLILRADRANGAQAREINAYLEKFRRGDRIDYEAALSGGGAPQFEQLLASFGL